VDEYNTSKTCSGCHCALSNARAMSYNHKEGSVATKRSRIHKVLHCSSSAKSEGLPCCGTTWNRDVNASLNILRLGVLEIFELPRPAAFVRKATPNRTRRGSASTKRREETCDVWALLSSVPLFSAPTSASEGIQSMRVRAKGTWPCAKILCCGSHPFVNRVNDLVYARGVPE
jgi:hypothetical protein